MEDELMERSKKHLQEASKHDLENAIREFELQTRDDNSNIKKRSVGGKQDCPVMDNTYLAAHSSTGSSSLSPYAPITDFNPKRLVSSCC